MTNAPHALYDVWQGEELDNPFPWYIQLHGYVGRMESREVAEKYVAAVKAYRARV